ncbi:lysylphosphatidylglycerol synthase transmembrane domain-containing protein [Lacticaseibacillus nasuensis]|uniref:Phosphatidylglycerol lysyltransferase n=1 Tax=Lacticaseibacillus nasuensis JCM 17158 TaxID=1291734 RepID=A0A0R1JQD7_9LACO|nr:lysylphosphatidylglycerol synthase transmembrane domain-containing protein [Lacticaseibacillus nasuensis]KRK71395.1 integral membrane protein [Lacticaseibacillus nasuensis JCM 17158]
MTRKNKIAVAVMIAIGVAIFLWEMRNVDVHAAWHTLLTLRLQWLAVAFLVILLSYVIEALVVQIFVAHEGEHLTFKSAMRVPLIEQLFNAITPFSTGGQPAQLVALMQSGVEGGRASSVLLMKFIVYQFMVLINFVFTLFIGLKHLAAQFGPLAWLIVFGFTIHLLVIAGLLLIMYQYRFTKRLVAFGIRLLRPFVSAGRRAAWQATMDAKIDTFYAESVHLKQEKTKVIRAALLTFVQLLLYYSVPYFVLLSFGVPHVNLVHVMVLHVMIVMIISLFPIPGGAGGAEYSFKALFATFMGPAQLVLAMLLWRFITYYLGMVCGIVALAVVPDRLESTKPQKS